MYIQLTAVRKERYRRHQMAYFTVSCRVLSCLMGDNICNWPFRTWKHLKLVIPYARTSYICILYPYLKLLKKGLVMVCIYLSQDGWFYECLASACNICFWIWFVYIDSVDYEFMILCAFGIVTAPADLCICGPGSFNNQYFLWMLIYSCNLCRAMTG